MAKPKSKDRSISTQAFPMAFLQCLLQAHLEAANLILTLQSPPMDSSEPNTAIIGAGLSGLTLALVLKHGGTRCTIYEQQSRSAALGGAIMLSPNALRILDRLRIYERVHDKGFLLDTVSLRDEHENELNKFYFGSKKMYQYNALRISREIMVREFLAVVEEEGIDLVFDSTLVDVTPSTLNDWTLQLNFANGFTRHVTRVIGADGIHSNVRRAIYPDFVPRYSGQLAVTSSPQRSHMSFPASGEYKLPAFIFANPGAFLMLPHDPKGEQMGICRQWKFEERDRTGWAALAADKDQLMNMLRSDYEYWPKIAQSCLDMAKPEELGIWPYYTLPRLKKWTPTDNKLIIVGDAQHAIPPTDGQGALHGY